MTLRADGTQIWSLEVMKKSKLLNTASSKALPCVNVLDVFRALIAYAGMFNECDPISIRDGRLYNVRRDMESASFIPGVKPTVYNRYIPFARMCIMHPTLLDLIIDLNNRDSVRPKKTTNKINLNNPTDYQIAKLEEDDLLLYVEGSWYLLNTKAAKARSKRAEFVRKAFKRERNRQSRLPPWLLGDCFNPLSQHPSTV